MKVTIANNEDLFRSPKMSTGVAHVAHDANFMKNKQKIKAKWKSNNENTRFRRYKMVTLSPSSMQIGPYRPAEDKFKKQMRIKMVEDMLKHESKYGSSNLKKLNSSKAIGKKGRILDQFSSLTHAKYEYLVDQNKFNQTHSSKKDEFGLQAINIVKGDKKSKEAKYKTIQYDVVVKNQPISALDVLEIKTPMTLDKSFEFDSNNNI